MNIDNLTATAFLRDVKCSMVTGFDTHSQRYSADRKSCYDVHPLVEWALDLELIEHGDLDTKRRELGFVMRLTATGLQELNDRRNGMRVAAGLI